MYTNSDNYWTISLKKYIFAWPINLFVDMYMLMRISKYGENNSAGSGYCWSDIPGLSRGVGLLTKKAGWLQLRAQRVPPCNRREGILPAKAQMGLPKWSSLCFCVHFEISSKSLGENEEVFVFFLILIYSWEMEREKQRHRQGENLLLHEEVFEQRVPYQNGRQQMRCTLLNPSVRSQLANLNDRRRHLTRFVTPSLEHFNHRLSQFSPNFPRTTSQPLGLVSKLSEFEVPHTSDLETLFLSILPGWPFPFL